MTDRRVIVLVVAGLAGTALVSAVLRGAPAAELLDLVGLMVAALLPSPLSKTAVPEVPPET